MKRTILKNVGIGLCFLLNTLQKKRSKPALEK